jgi:hypothetical protein
VEWNFEEEWSGDDAEEEAESVKAAQNWGTTEIDTVLGWEGKEPT